jgi:PAS domain S-box-containing protein
MLAGVLVTLTLALRLIADFEPGDAPQLAVFTVPIAASAVFGRRSGYFALVLSLVLAKLLLVAEIGSLVVATTADAVRLATLFLAAIGIIELVVRLRESRRAGLRAADEARASAANLALLIQHMPTAVALFDREMRYLAYSRRFVEDYGLPEGSLVGRSHYEVFPELPEFIRAIHRRCLAGAVESGEATRFLRLDGRVDWVRWSVHPWHDAAGEIGGIVLFTEVITQQTLARQAEETARAQLEAAFGAIQDGIAVFDRTGRVVHLNAAQARINGFPDVETMRRELGFYEARYELRRPDGLIVPPEEWPVSRVLRGQTDDQILHVTRVDTGQQWVMRLTGAPVFDAGGAVDLAVVVTRDITEEWHAKARLAAASERLAVTLQSVAEGVIATDETGRITLVNPMAESLTGWSAAEAVGRPLDEVYRTRTEGSRPDDPAAGACLLARDGSSHPIGETLAPLRTASGASLGQVLAFRDQTGEREARRLREALLQSQKLESLGLLAGGVAHDFNNLLTVIINCADAVRDALVEGRRPDAEDVGQIRESGDRAAALTRQLLAFARKQVVAPVVLDLNALVLSSQKMLARLLGEHIRVETALDVDLWPVRMDPGQFEQVVVNLAVNARDAMPLGGRLRISTRNVPAGDGAAAGDRVRVEVADDGEGMTADVQAHVFEPFFTTKPTGQGTGLGLATVHGIVRQAAGAITVESAPGAGARFVSSSRDTWARSRRRRPPRRRPGAARRSFSWWRTTPSSVGSSSGPCGAPGIEFWRPAAVRRRLGFSSAPPRTEPPSSCSSATSSCPKWTAHRCLRHCAPAARRCRPSFSRGIPRTCSSRAAS